MITPPTLRFWTKEKKPTKDSIKPAFTINRQKILGTGILFEENPANYFFQLLRDTTFRSASVISCLAMHYDHIDI